MARQIIRDPVTGKILTIKNVPDDFAELEVADNPITPVAAQRQEQSQPLIPVPVSASPSPRPAPTPMIDLINWKEISDIKTCLIGIMVDINATNPNRSEIKFAVKDRWQRQISQQITRLDVLIQGARKIAS
jgi:hypothetical protein